MKPISRVFCSYAHEDAHHVVSLREHLAALRRSGCIQMWSDHDISVGEKWNQKISEALEDADVVLMLISPSFIASDYCFEMEMTRTLELAELGQVIALPILIRACDWESMPFAQLQVMPNDRQPITPIASRPENERDEAWSSVARAIRNLLVRHLPADSFQPMPSKPAEQGIAKGELVLRFLRTWPRWGFNLARIQNWGGRQPGFEDLSRKSSDELRTELEDLVRGGKIESFGSKAGNLLYKASSQ